MCNTPIDMKSTFHLYGCKATEFMDLTYKQALLFKIDKCTELLKELRTMAIEVQNEPNAYTPILNRYIAVEKAREFNRELLEEIKG